MVKYLIIFPTGCNVPSNLVPNRYSEQICYLLLTTTTIQLQHIPECAVIFKYSDDISFENVLITIELYQQIQKLENKISKIEAKLKTQTRKPLFQASFSLIIDSISEINILLDLIIQIQEKYQQILTLGFHDSKVENKLKKLEEKYEQYTSLLRNYERHLKKLELVTSILLTLVGILLGIVFR